MQWSNGRVLDIRLESSIRFWRWTNLTRNCPPPGGLITGTCKGEESVKLCNPMHLSQHLHGCSTGGNVMGKVWHDQNKNMNQIVQWAEKCMLLTLVPWNDRSRELETTVTELLCLDLSLELCALATLINAKLKSVKFNSGNSERVCEDYFSADGWESGCGRRKPTKDVTRTRIEACAFLSYCATQWLLILNFPDTSTADNPRQSPTNTRTHHHAAQKRLLIGSLCDAREIVRERHLGMQLPNHE